MAKAVGKSVEGSVMVGGMIRADELATVMVNERVELRSLASRSLMSKEYVPARVGDPEMMPLSPEDDRLKPGGSVDPYETLQR